MFYRTIMLRCDAPWPKRGCDRSEAARLACRRRAFNEARCTLRKYIAYVVCWSVWGFVVFLGCVAAVSAFSLFGCLWGMPSWSAEVKATRLMAGGGLGQDVAPPRDGSSWLCARPKRGLAGAISLARGAILKRTAGGIWLANGPVYVKRPATDGSGRSARPDARATHRPVRPLPAGATAPCDKDGATFPNRAWAHRCAIKINSGEQGAVPQFGRYGACGMPGTRFTRTVRIRRLPRAFSSSRRWDTTCRREALPQVSMNDSRSPRNVIFGQSWNNLLIAATTASAAG